jgi:hypothetical protein
MHYLVVGDFQVARIVPERTTAGPARRSRGSGWGTSRPLATLAAAILASTGGDEGRCHRAAAGGLLRTARLGDAVTRCVAARDLERLLSFRAHTAICPQPKGFSGGPAWTRTRDLLLIREEALLSPRTVGSANHAFTSTFLLPASGSRFAEYRRVTPWLVSALVSNLPGAKHYRAPSLAAYAGADVASEPYGSCGLRCHSLGRCRVAR